MDRITHEASMSAILYWFLPFLLAPVYFFLRCTWRIREYGPPEIMHKYVRRMDPCVFAHWHGDELLLVGYYSFRGLAVLSSLSKDGTLMARTLRLLGYKVFRGSSSRGGARGLIGLIRAVKSGNQAALAVDGPKGPIYQVKPGIVDLARKTGMPIIPCRARADRAWYIPRAWNKSYLPKPLARIEVEYGMPVHCGEKSSEEIAADVKARLDGIPGAFPSYS
jgi:lysophospholipid acyltransferase (LPLAT)-like uncharacterized protein